MVTEFGKTLLTAGQVCPVSTDIKNIWNFGQNKYKLPTIIRVFLKIFDIFKIFSEITQPQIKFDWKYDGDAGELARTTFLSYAPISNQSRPKRLRKSYWFNLGGGFGFHNTKTAFIPSPVKSKTFKVWPLLFPPHPPKKLWTHIWTHYAKRDRFQEKMKI